MQKLGLVGKNIGYSFSKNYFADKFIKEGITDISYENFDIPSIEDFSKIIQNNTDLIGLNVTIPYKESVIPFLDSLSAEAEKIGAVNTIKITSDKKLMGHNTDFVGFQNSIKPLLQSHHKKALILGTGGASKAIMFALQDLGIEYQLVSRKKTNKTITYQDITEEVIKNHFVIINCTPIGTFPNTDDSPEIPYEFLSKNHLVYDLIYNPEKTTFLQKAEEKSATIKNGYDMLVLQAEAAWEIWNK